MTITLEWDIVSSSEGQDRRRRKHPSADSLQRIIRTMLPKIAAAVPAGTGQFSARRKPIGRSLGDPVRATPRPRRRPLGREEPLARSQLLTPLVVEYGKQQRTATRPSRGGRAVGAWRGAARSEALEDGVLTKPERTQTHVHPAWKIC